MSDNNDRELSDEEYPADSRPVQKRIAVPTNVAEIATDNEYQDAGSPHARDMVVDSSSPIAPYFRMYRWHPFTELFCAIAEWFEDVTDAALSKKQFDLKQRSRMKEKHKYMFYGAAFLDLLLLLFIVVALCGAVIYVALSAVGIDVKNVIETHPLRIPVPTFDLST